MVAIYEESGLKTEASQEIVEILAQNRKGFLKVMMIEELKLISNE
jgi:hypothetical protein